MAMQHKTTHPAVALDLDSDLAGRFDPVTYEQWRSTVEHALEGAPFEKRLVTRTYEDIEIQPIYTAHNSTRLAEFPGVVPFTRGSRAVGSAREAWDIRQEHADPSPGTANTRILEDLLGGVTSVTLRLDSAARRGLHPSHSAAAALVARDGIAIHNLDAFDRTLASVHLEMIGLHLEAGAMAPFAAGWLPALARRREIDASRLHGSLRFDPIAVLARDGELPYDAHTASKLAANLTTWAAEELPGFSVMRIGTAPYHHAGATATQDLAFLLATGVQYLRWMTEHGVPADAAARACTLELSLGTKFFLGAAKLRAARRLWSRVLEAVGVQPIPVPVHARPSKRVMTTRDPWVNILRNTACVFAAGVGGADSIESTPYDVTLGTPDGDARRLARNTPIIAQEESHIMRSVDPAGGSWFVEHLTDELCARAWALFQDLERAGGMFQLVQSGEIANRIDAARAPRDRNLATRRDAVLGVSMFANPEERVPERTAEDYAAIRAATVAGVPNSDVELARSTDSIARAAAALADNASLADTAAAVLGAQQPTACAPIHPHPYAEAFEALREATDVYAARCGARPVVCLVELDTVATSAARSGFARGFFEAGGFDVRSTGPILETDDVASAFATSDSHIAVLCSSDAVYAARAADVARTLRNAGARHIVLAGAPGDHESVYRAAGIDRFIFVKCDVLGVLRELLTEEGVLS